MGRGIGVWGQETGIASPVQVAEEKEQREQGRKQESECCWGCGGELSLDSE